MKYLLIAMLLLGCDKSDDTLRIIWFANNCVYLAEQLEYVKPWISNQYSDTSLACIIDIPDTCRPVTLPDNTKPITCKSVTITEQEMPGLLKSLKLINKGK